MVDMEKLAQQNELMPAIGNMKVNARGDELGPGGKIIRRREDIISNYYDTNPKAAPRSASPISEKVSVKGPPATVAPTINKQPPQVVVPEPPKSKKTQVE
jgi:hypothetical protein